VQPALPAKQKDRMALSPQTPRAQSMEHMSQMEKGWSRPFESIAEENPLVA